MERFHEILNAIAQAIYDKKGANILAIDVRGVSEMTECFIIAEGNVDRHVNAIASAIQEEMKERGLELLHREGVRSGDWAVLDYGEVVVHLFLPDMRHRYDLEQVWREGKVVDVDIAVRAGGTDER